MGPIDPLHTVPSTDSAWTTVNIGEAFPGLQTPLSWTAFSGPCERGVRRGLRDLGGFTRAELDIPQRVEDRLLAIFYGRCAGGVDALRKVMDRIPGNSGDKFEEHILGSVRPGLPNHRILRRYPVAIARATHALATSTRRLRQEAADTQTWWRRVCFDQAHPGCAAEIFGEAQQRVETTFRRHMTVRMLGQGLFDRVCELAAAHGPDGCALALTAGYGGLDESDLIDHLLQVSRDELPLAAFLDRFGYHGPAEGDVASHSWREDPRPLERWIHRMHEEGPRADPAIARLLRTNDRVAAERALLAALPTYKRPTTALTLKLTRHFVVLGELGKATFLRAFDGLRFAARARGRELVDAGVLDSVEDIFLLTADEAFSATLDRDQAAELRRIRGRTQDAYRLLRLPQAWVGAAPELAVTAHDTGDERTICGIAASPGHARGPARVVLDAADVDIREGEILVCETTDPAWTPHIYAAAAVVTDIGSSMSHGAIIARELGVPCVTGTRTGTVRIRSGDHVSVDGSRGAVVIEMRSPVQRSPESIACSFRMEATMNDLPQPLEDLSAFVISGRVKSHLTEQPEFETSIRTPAQGLADAVEAERLGYRQVFIAERPELKEPGALLGGIGALTSQIGLGVGLVAIGSRHPMLLASLGATLQAAYGPRFTLGIGRGAHSYGHGGHTSRQAFADYCSIVKRIWAGEQFEYDGPAGSFGKLGLADRYEGPAPEILCGAFGLPQSAKMVAATPEIDGLLLPAMVTPRGVAQAVANVGAACHEVGRDPAEIRIVVEVVTAPGLSDAESRQLAHARAVTYLQPLPWARSYAQLNGWSLDVIQQMREHPQFASVGGLVDLSFHRRQLAEPARLIPDEWMSEACALGSVDDCVRKLQEFKDAGADEIATYGSTPGQNAQLVAAWRAHSATRTPEVVQ